MYHKTRRYRAQLAAARAAKERKRLEGEAPTYPTERPRRASVRSVPLGSR